MSSTIHWRSDTRVAKCASDSQSVWTSFRSLPLSSLSAMRSVLIGPSRVSSSAAKVSLTRSSRASSSLVHFCCTTVSASWSRDACSSKRSMACFSTPSVLAFISPSFESACSAWLAKRASTSSTARSASAPWRPDASTCATSKSRKRACSSTKLASHRSPERWISAAWVPNMSKAADCTFAASTWLCVASVCRVSICATLFCNPSNAAS
mmetsp:Transcript_66745/g.186081  ORF Transcript_66745/g.186081 Transcript_66745/m.186081 type:complete len:209 (-) Transcript_66745:2511-3137(-)